MSNVINFKIKNDDKIIVQEDKPIINQITNTIQNNKNENKKSLFDKLEDVKLDEIIINKKNYKKYKNTKNHLINETKHILEKSYDEYYKSIENYYQDVLNWMNLLFSDDAKSILKIKIVRIVINEDIFLIYNDIINKYKLNKNTFCMENFNIEHDNNRDVIIEIIKTMTRNLLEKLNYKLEIKNYNNKKKLIIKNLSNQI
jgi:hypothetical protein